jgi:alpha-ketoglutarate-dependent taurine dioxygenase
MTVTTFSTRDLTPRIATEIRTDKRYLLSGVHADILRELLERRGVLVFPQIHLTDEEQVTFTETLGTLAIERHGEQVYNVTLDTTVNKQAAHLKGSLHWHIDGTMNKVPSFASLLSSKALPRNGGGDTEFCNTYAAYEDLPTRTSGRSSRCARCIQRGIRCCTTTPSPTSRRWDR